MSGNVVGASSRCHHYTVGFDEPGLLQGNSGFVVSVIFQVRLLTQVAYLPRPNHDTQTATY